MVTALRHKQKVIIGGGGGSIGSQDWMKIALLMKKAAIDPKTIKYVAFEGGGGEALSAFSAGYIDVFFQAMFQKFMDCLRRKRSKF